jgi:hypothetical protein
VSTIRDRDARYWTEGYSPKLHDGRGAAALDRHALLVAGDALAEALSCLDHEPDGAVRLPDESCDLCDALARWAEVTGSER